MESLPAIPVPGAKPSQSLADILANANYRAARTEGEPSEDVAGARSHVVWEAIYLLHKGAHVVRAAQAHAHVGKRSWALFSAYHGAYLCAKSILALLGVCLPQPDGQQLLVDFFPQTKPPRGSRSRSERPLPQFAFYFLGHLDRQNLWELFQRTLRMAEAVPIDERIKTLLIDDLDWAAIPRKRNPYLYNAVFWPYDDLLTDAPMAQFCFSPERDEEGNWFVQIDSDGFLLRYAFIVQSVAESLLASIAARAPIVQLEYDLIRAQDHSADNVAYNSFKSAFTE